MSTELRSVNPPSRLLMGPGPINADPRVLRAMSSPLIGQYDPVMTQYMNETMALYRHVFQTTNEQTFVIDGTSRAGIEAALVSLVSPGDRVLVPVFGRFGLLLQEIAERIGAEVHTVHAEWGQIVDPELVIAAMDEVHPSVVACVQGDTATTICQPLAEIGAACAERGILLYTDVTASLGGNTFLMDDWHIDAATAGLQKCLAGPSGSSPISLSPRAVERINSRKQVEAGIREASDADNDDVIASNYFDLAQIMDYWGPHRLNHHTEATSALYGAREVALNLNDEGIENAVARHALHGEAMARGLLAMGLELFGDQRYRMNNVIGVVIPDAVDGEAVRGRMLNDFGIEIGTSFGPLKGRVWRIGVMGYNARKDTVLVTLAALEATLKSFGMVLNGIGGAQAALDFYAETA